MLIKKELEHIAILECPSLPPIEKKSYSSDDKYVATAKVLHLKRSGKILVIDVFHKINKTLEMRFFSDGKSFLVCKEWPAKKYVTRIPSYFLEDKYTFFNIDALDSDIKLAHEVLKDNQLHWHYKCGIKDEMDSFARGLNEKKQQQAAEKKHSMMLEHFNMFPEYPRDLAEYCETNVFGYTYIFLSKIQKDKRKAVCGHCGHNFSVSRNIKPGKKGSCPACNMTAGYRAMWANGTHKDKSQICITHKNQNQLLIRWTNVVRTFTKTKQRYEFDDFCYNLYLNTSKGPVIYAYKYQPIAGFGTVWVRKKNGYVHYGKSYVYTNNLREVFGDSYYHVDLQLGLKNAGKLSFISLLNHLKNIPAAEYLFKMGLTALAAGMYEDDLSKGAGFTEVLGVSKQYLSLYKKFNVTPLEHDIIKDSKTWVSEASFEKFRLLKPDYRSVLDIKENLKKMSFERFANYFLKQNEITSKKLQSTLTLYLDYISMSETLKVDMSRKSVRFPRNIKEAHDQILSRYNQVKNEVEDKKFKKAVKGLYVGMPEYAKGNYSIIYPVLRSDLIMEGQSLKHCVGADRYYQNHIAGTRMIFFIRKANEPERPYFTMEINMKEFRVLQLYGFKDCSAPPDVRKFADEFIKKLKLVRKENKTKVSILA